MDSEIGTANQDDFLPPLVRLQKFANSDVVFDRWVIYTWSFEDDLSYVGGSGSSVGIATGYGYRIFPGGEERPGRDADPSPPSSAVVVKGYSYTSTPPVSRTAYTEPQCLYKGDLYL